MSGTEDEGAFVEADEAFEEELEDAPEPRLRRGLFGYRRADVRAELEAQAIEVDEMRDELAALWLAFNQHERTIRDLITAVRKAGGSEVDPPGARTMNDLYTNPNEGSARSDAWVADQLEGLDEVLGAIKQATELLERGYEGEIAPQGHPQPPAPQAPPPPQARAASPQLGRSPLPPMPQPPPSGKQPLHRDAAGSRR